MRINERANEDGVFKEEDLFAVLNDELTNYINHHKDVWAKTSRLGYSTCGGWNKVVRDEFGTKCFKLAFGNNGGSQTSNNKWKDYLEDISDFVVDFEKKMQELFGEQASVWITNIVFDVTDDVYDAVFGVSVGEDFDPFESDEMGEKLCPPRYRYGDGQEPTAEEIAEYENILGPYYDREMDDFSEGWIH